jgi:nicotinamidase-related amidase
MPGPAGLSLSFRKENRSMKIDPSRTAVLALHLLGDVVRPEGAFGAVFAGEVQRRKVVEHTEDLIATARSAGAAVIYTRVRFKSDYSDLHENAPLFVGARESGAMNEESPTAEIISELTPEPHDLVITNTRRRGITTLLLAGVATNITVSTTARQASDLGFRTFIVEDCCATASQELHETTLAGLELLIEGAPSSAEAIAAIQG